MTLSGKDNGFSLMELVVAMAILAILAAIGYPAFRTWSNNAAYRERARDLVSSLRLERDKAVTDNAVRQLQVDMGPQDNMVLKSTDNCDKDYPLKVSFFPDGSLSWDTAGGDPEGTVCILDADGNKRYKVRIESATTGRVTITKP